MALYCEAPRHFNIVLFTSIPIVDEHTRAEATVLGCLLAFITIFLALTTPESLLLIPLLQTLLQS